MKEKMYLSIPDPCHENWNEMTPVEQGRFCSSCQKNVVDFTMQTDEDIISFFNNYNGSACGRFTDDQLDRPIQQFEFKPASSFLKYAAGLLLPAFLFVTKAKGQSTDLKPTITSEPSKVDISQMLTGIVGGINIVTSPSSFYINGKVVDAKSKEPLAGVSVMIKGSSKGVIADSVGNFSIKVPSNQAVLKYSSVGYEAMEIRAVKSSNLVLIEMYSSKPGLLNEVVVVGYAMVKKGGVGGSVSIRTSRRISFLDSLLPAKVKVYPNPVPPSGTINISFPNVKEGLYQIRLLSSTGQLLYSFQKQINSKNQTEQIHLNSQMAAGVYVLQVMDEQKKLIQSNKVIVQ